MRTNTFTINKSYSDFSATGTDVYTTPMYDQDYSINYSYPDTAFGNQNFTETEFADYQLAFNTDLIKTYNLNWSGLTESEKEIFENIFNAFNNSWQPFTFKVYEDATPLSTFTCIINSGTITISKDKFNLYSINFSLTVIL